MNKGNKKSELTKQEMRLLPIALGSYWGLIAMATIPFALLLRILNEEKLLLKELPGYDDYCRNTKYRLIPYIW